MAVATSGNSTADAIVSASVYRNNTSVVGDGVGLVLRYTDNDNWIMVFVIKIDATSYSVVAEKKTTAGGIVFIGSSPVAYVSGALLNVVANGNLLDVYYNGDYVVSYTVTDVGLQTGYNGVVTVKLYDDANGADCIDNFTVQALGSIGISDGFGHPEGRSRRIGSGGSGLSWTTVSGTPSISTGKLTFTAAGTVKCDVQQADLYTKIRFTTPAAGTDAAGVLVRYYDADNYWYIKIIPGTAGNDFQLIERNAGGETVRAEADIDWAVSTEYFLDIVCHGNVYKIMQSKSTTILNYTDAGSFNIAKTVIGITDSANNNFQFNDIVVFNRCSSQYNILDSF